MPGNRHLGIICLLALIVTQVSIPEIGATAPGTRVRIEPADSVVSLNETFVVQVIIEEADDLGGFEFGLTYDSSILEVTDAVLGDFLGSTGRSVALAPIGPEVNDAQGRVTLVGFSFGSGPGPSGMGVLAAITCIAQGEGSTVLGLQQVRVVDTAPSPSEWVTVEDGQVTVRGAAAPTPSATATSEPAATATPGPAATATPEPAATATPEPAATATPGPAATASPGPTDTPEAVNTLTPSATAPPPPAPTVTNPAVETSTKPPSPTPSPTPMPGVSTVTTETRPTATATTTMPPAVPTTEATQMPAAATTAPTSPPATLPPPSPSATPAPSPPPLATIPVPATTGRPVGAVLGLMLAALAMASLAVFVLSRRPGD